MCGIAGIVANNSRYYRPQVSRMVASLRHRGPDGGGVHYFPNCALGHRRLDIIDLITGDQPMFSPDKKVALTFNGEIYGYKEIRDRLKNYPFATTSDTEVVLALYEKFGPSFVSHLPGMFAFVLWDEKKQLFIAARDRFGEKPLFYALGPKGEFIFASEIKAIIASGPITPVINSKMLSYYLKYLYIPVGQTIYTNIFTLAPAQMLTFRLGKIAVSTYWTFPPLDNSITLTEATEQFGSLLGKAVHDQLIADVPVGALLSGGVDSSSVVALASTYKAKLKTFSFGFEGDRSELPYARTVAHHFKTDHYEFLEKDTNVAELILEMAKIYDEPFADSSNIPTYLISKLARKKVKVALTGDGGDELLGGYTSWYRPLLLLSQPENKAWLKLALLTLFRPWLSRDQNFHRQSLHDRVLGRNLPQVHDRQLTRFSDEEISLLGLPKIPRPSLRSKNLNDILRSDARNYLSGDILVKTDRASMAWGLELRAPFLNVDLASFCLALPYNLKLTDQDDKIILKKAFASQLPPEILARRKRGFGAPIERWLLQKPVRRLTHDYLGDPKQPLFSVIPHKAVHYLTGKNGYKTWALLNLAIWWKGHDYEVA